MNRRKYRQKHYDCGNFRYVYVYPVQETGRKSLCEDGRRRRYRETTETKKNINKRHAQERAVRLHNANFSDGDILLTLTYETEPDSWERANKELTAFIRSARNLYRKAGIEFKWFAVTEGPRYHHHMTLSAGVDRDELEALWAKGYANTKKAKTESDGLESWARYITKRAQKQEGKGRHGYRHSRNLIDPEPRISDEKVRSRRRADRLASQDMGLWKELHEGYELQRVERFAENTGEVFIVARLRRDGRQNE